MKTIATVSLCLLLSVSSIRAANTARLYDFEEGMIGSTSNTVLDKVDTALFNGGGTSSGLYWLEVSGVTPRPLPDGGLVSVVDSVALTTPPLNAFFGAVEFEDVSNGSPFASPQPGSTIAARFDGSTILEDFETAAGSRGVFVQQSAFDNDDVVEPGVNTFEDFSILAQGWVRPDSADMGVAQTVWRVGNDQGRLRISDDATPVWQVVGLGSNFENDGLFPEVSVAFDEWTHIGIFRGGAGAEVYINGELVAGDRSPMEPKFIGTFADNISLGGDSLEFETFTGLIDDFKISGFADPNLGPEEMDYCSAVPGAPTCPQVRQPCDLVSNGQCDIADLDLLIAQVIRGSGHSAFDLNGDGTLDINDIVGPDGWLEVAGAQFANLGLTGGNPFLVGDANLDGVVDVSDFNVFNENKFTETGRWSQGDFNADNVTDVADFNAWNENKFQASSGAAAVPEPSGYGLMGLMVAAMGLAVRKMPSRG